MKLRKFKLNYNWIYWNSRTFQRLSRTLKLHF